MIASQTDIANRQDFTNTFTAEYDKNMSAVTVITPSTGKQIKVTGVFLSTEGSTAAGGKVQVHFATSANTAASIYVTNAVQNTKVDPVNVLGAVDEPLKITSTLGDDKNFYISINYREEQFSTGI